MRALLLILATAISLSAHAGAMFGAGRLVSSPVADTLDEGEYELALSGRYEDVEGWQVTDTLVSLDFGVAPRAQAGVAFIDRRRPDADRHVSWDVRVQPIRASGGMPGVALGAFGTQGDMSQTWAYAVVSKAMNLPRAGFFTVHVGARADLSTDAEDRALPLGGISKRFRVRGRALKLAADWDGNAGHIGVVREYSTGMRVAIGATVASRSGSAVTDRALLVSAGFGSAEVSDGIEAAKRLARQAARLAVEPPPDAP
ncbi:hypothetical protein FJZ36_12550 [Candidatus Poribacteria bacterium]|nr:hypothetical protein [Candidatus Poribacteria bacterium]